MSRAPSIASTATSSAASSLPSRASTPSPNGPRPTACTKATVTKARVLIVGAGIGGIMLGALLERAGIEYHIFERAVKVKPLGSALSIGANVLPLFAQLSVLDDVMKAAKSFSFSTGYNDLREVTRTLDYSPAEEIGGFLPHIISRPILVDILMKLVPTSKISYSKKILSCRQNETEAPHVVIQCSDNSTYEGEILVGADGAYSGVRQNLYKQLKTDGVIPKSDLAELPFNSVCLVGQTEQLDPEVYTHLKDDHTWFETTVGEGNPYAWITFTTKFNTICWMVLRHLDEKSSRENESSFRNSEWGPEAAEAMCEEVKDFPVPRNNMVLGDLIAKTPKEYISKVMLEEKLFDTWYGGRMVLIGDACHKMFPAAGLGAVSAMQDAVCLANCLYELSENPTTEEISKVFANYQDERYPLAKTAYDTSHRLGSIVGSRWYNRVLRTVMNYLPKSVFTRSLVVMYSYRPQASFLEPFDDRGVITATSQPSLERARARAAQESATTTQAV